MLTLTLADMAVVRLSVLAYDTDTPVLRVEHVQIVDRTVRRSHTDIRCPLPLNLNDGDLAEVFNGRRYVQHGSVVLEFKPAWVSAAAMQRLAKFQSPVSWVDVDHRVLSELQAGQAGQADTRAPSDLGGDFRVSLQGYCLCLVCLSAYVASMRATVQV